MFQPPPGPDRPPQIRQVDQVLELGLQIHLFPPRSKLGSTLVLVGLDGVPVVFRIQHLAESFELETYRAGGVQGVLVDEHEEVGEHGPFAEKG